MGAGVTGWEIRPTMALQDRRGLSRRWLTHYDPYYRKWTVQTGVLFLNYSVSRRERMTLAEREYLIRATAGMLFTHPIGRV